MCRLHLVGGATLAKTEHCQVAGLGGGCDAAPAAVLPPQDHIDQLVPIGQSIGVADQPCSPSRRRDIGDAGPKPQVLPARVRDVMDPPPRGGQVPIDEGHRTHPRPRVPVHRVLRRQVVVAHHLTLTGKIRRGRQVVKLPDQFGDPPQALVAVDSGRLNRLPRHMAMEETQRLPPLFIDPQKPRGAFPTGSLQQTQQPVHELRTSSTPSAHRVTHTNAHSRTRPAAKPQTPHQSPLLLPRSRTFLIATTLHSWTVTHRVRPSLRRRRI